MIPKIIIGALVIFTIGVVLFLVYIGFFSAIVIKEKEVGSFVLIYEEHRGDYRGTAEIQDKIYYSLLNEYKIETFKGFGIYYDDPKKVSKEKLRSIAGCILEETDYDKIEILKENGFNLKELSKQDSLVVEFPYKHFFSIIAGIMKVYPAIRNYIVNNNLVENEIMEI